MSTLQEDFETLHWAWVRLWVVAVHKPLRGLLRRWLDE